MKCPYCGTENHISFLGIWYVQQGQWWVLMTHYGCTACLCAFDRPVSEDSFYYRKENGEIIMRPTYNPARGETRVFIVDMDPGNRVRLDV